VSRPEERPVESDAGGVPPTDGANVISFPSGRRSAPVEQQPGRGLRDVLGEVLREERHRQQRTLADVAGAAAVSLPYLSEIERGRKEVSSDLLGVVCDALEVPLVEVLERCVDRLRARAQGGLGIQLRAA
jgi:hypothetical protein